MKIDFELLKRLLNALQTDEIPYGFASEYSRAFREADNNEETEINKFKLKHNLSSFEDKLLIWHWDFLKNSKMKEVVFVTDNCTPFGARFSAFLNNKNLFQKVAEKMGETIFIHTPQTIMAIAQQIDLKDKGISLPDRQDGSDIELDFSQ